MLAHAEDGIIGMGDAATRGGARLDAYLELTMTVHRQALRSLRRRGIGALGLARHRPDQGVLLAHHNPYDVVAGHAIARAAGDITATRAPRSHPGVERSHGGRPRHPARARQPRRSRSRGGGGARS